MRLYYDTLVPFMPDSIKDDEGNLIHDEIKASGRFAMIELAKFQQYNSISSLFDSIVYACKYAGTDVIDTIIAIQGQADLPDGLSITSVLDNVAIELFKSVKPDYHFDVYKFTAHVLAVTHSLLVAMHEDNDLESASKKSEEVKE